VKYAWKQKSSLFLRYFALKWFCLHYLHFFNQIKNQHTILLFKIHFIFWCHISTFWTLWSKLRKLLCFIIWENVFRIESSLNFIFHLCQPYSYWIVKITAPRYTACVVAPLVHALKGLNCVNLSRPYCVCLPGECFMTAVRRCFLLFPVK